MNIGTIARILFFLLIGAAAASPAGAQSYPSQPVTMLVSFPPGGVTDSLARALANEMSRELGQMVVVVNRTGASGAIGTAAIAHAPANGYTVGFIAAAALTIVPQMRATPYRLDSFDYLCRTFDVPIFVLVTPDSRFRTIRELIDYAKSNPGKLNYATVGPGSLPHMAALDFSKAGGVAMNHVPYKGEGPAVADLLGKHVDLYFGTNAVAAAHNLRRLAVAADARAAEAPDTPTLAEILGRKVSWSVMGGLIAPKGMDPAIRTKLHESCAAATRTPSYRASLENLKIDSAYADGDTFRKLLAADAAKNQELLREAGLLAP